MPHFIATHDDTRATSARAGAGFGRARFDKTVDPVAVRDGFLHGACVHVARFYFRTGHDRSVRTGDG